MQGGLIMAEDNKTKVKYNYRFLARLVIETKAPLNIGSGNKGIKTDSLVLRDVNGLPFIPGTTLIGLTRHACKDAGMDVDSLFGFQRFAKAKENEPNGMGSRLIFTEARILNSTGDVIDGYKTDAIDDDILNGYKVLPIRQHVRINHRGTAEKGGKFDEEVVLKGTRFCFEIEMIASEEEFDTFKAILGVFHSPVFRIGSGSRSGFGEICVKSCKYVILNISNETGKPSYLNKPSSLSSDFFKDIQEEKDIKGYADGWIRYALHIKPKDFVLFGSGFSDEYGWADMTYVKEKYVKWTEKTDNNGKVMSVSGIIVDHKKAILIPESSIKGALAHRVAFHYNAKTGKFANAKEYLDENGQIRDKEKYDEYVKSITGNNNPAVVRLFGSQGTKDANGKVQNKKRGCVLISDVIGDNELDTKYLNHVSIDRFTGGAIEGALFTEEVIYAKDKEITIYLYVDRAEDIKKEDANIISSFESALNDICNGMLSLGGGVNRGNGCFTGCYKIQKYNKEDKKWEELA